MLDRQALRSLIQQWNANRLDLFALSEPDENLLFHGVMRFYFQDAGQKVATKCIRVASDATVADVLDTLIEKFRPDMRMLSVPNYVLYEVHSNGEERKLNRDEKPLLVQLDWHIDDREGRFLLRSINKKINPTENTDTQFKRKLSKREKKEQKKQEKLLKQSWGSERNTENEPHVADKLYTELPDTSFTRSISNPEAVMRRRRQQKLEKKLQQFRSKDGGPDTGGTLKIYGESLCQDVPYKTLLLSIRDCAQAVVREMLSKYGINKADPLQYCLVQVNSDGTEYILDCDECPLSILMNHPTSRGSIMFHVRRRPADSQPRRRKKKTVAASNRSNSTSSDREGPVLVEITHSGDSGRRIKLGSNPIEIGSANTNSLQLFGPSIQARHCVISLLGGVCTVTPLHADALTFVNGHHITQPTILHNGSVVMIGRVASYRFLDAPSDGRFNLVLSQSQLDLPCLYESRQNRSRSPTISTSWNKDDENISTIRTGDVEKQTNNNHESSDEYRKQLSDGKQFHSHGTDNDPENDAAKQNLESETKSVSSLKSTESRSQDQRPQNKVNVLENQGKEFILPAVLEFPEKYQDQFLKQILTDLDVNMPHFKLAPVYSLYLCARYRASTHYRPELQPMERAHKLTFFLRHVAKLIYSIIQEQHANVCVLAFWMANSSEFLHFLKSDRHISAYSIQAQEILAESVQTAFHNLVNCFRVELSQTLNQFLSETIDHDSAAGLVLTVLGSAMALLRRCRVNAALTIQLFSQLFHYISAICFNTIIKNSHMCTAEWGKLLTDRLLLLELWAEHQGLELAADCHLSKINQCAQFLQSPKTSVEEIQKLTCSCFRLNSLQMAALLQQENIPRNLIDTAIRMAESVADELTRADGRDVRLEESPDLHLLLLLPEDGFSCDVVRGIPSGLLDFLNSLQASGICRLAAQPTSIGLWTVYMHQFNARPSSEMSNKLPQPETQVIKLQKNTNGMGLSIVAAKGAGQEQLGIYIKSVVPGGAADADGRLQAGDQLLRVDGQSLVGITQERAADYLVRTGPVVTLEVAKQGAIYHGLVTLLQQPSPIAQRDLNSISRSAHSSSINDQSVYQNLSPHQFENQSQYAFGERPSTEFLARNSLGGGYSKSVQQLSLSIPQQALANKANNNKNRPASACYQANSHPNFIENRNDNVNHKVISCDNLGKSLSSLNLNANANANANSNTYQLNSQQQNHEQAQINNTGNRIPNFSKEAQTQKSLRMSQTMMQNMPNISLSYSSHMFNTGMQNTSMMNQLANQADTQQLQQHQPTTHQQQQQQRIQNSVLSSQKQKSSSNFQPTIEEKTVRRNPRIDAMQDKSNEMNNHSNSQERITQQEQFYPDPSIALLKPNESKSNLRSFSMAFKEQQSSNIPHFQPNTEETLPLPPITTHPLIKGDAQSLQGLNSDTNSLLAQRSKYFTISASENLQSHISVGSLLDRDDRDKETEIRQENIKNWRDKQNSNYVSASHQFPKQEEQIETLHMGREFDRRTNNRTEEAKDDNESYFEKENYDEKTLPGSNQVLNTNSSQIDYEPKQQDVEYLEKKNINNNIKVQTSDSTMPNLYTGVQPKGILKYNRSENSSIPLTTLPTISSKPNKIISNEYNTYGENKMNTMSKHSSNLNLDKNLNHLERAVPLEHISQSSTLPPSINTSPPSPPERNTSYIVLSQRLQSNNNPNYPKPTFNSQNDTYNHNNNIPLKIDTHPLLNPSSHNLLILGRDTKQVSFHDEEQNYFVSPTSMPTYESNSDKMDINSQFDLSLESNKSLQSPQSPDSDLWNLTVKLTPGVIGAQEVYRDPRQRRLAEQHEKEQQRSSAAVPEKLTFKEKMKIFALESNEEQTSKDKLKISRAQ